MSKRTIYSSEHELLLKMLREIRKKRGYTQEEIAQSLSMDRSVFAKYERGEPRIDFVQVRDWCRAMKVSFLQFVRDYERQSGG